MLYMVEMNFPYPERQSEYDAWYDAHLPKLVAVPGFLTAQRFLSITPVPSPNLAIYTLASADVLTSAPYKEKFGPQAAGSFRELFTNWFRNMFSGVTEMPEISQDGFVALMDRKTPNAPPLAQGYISLKPAGLDRSVAERGLMIGEAGRQPPVPREAEDTSIRVYRPRSVRLLHGAA